MRKGDRVRELILQLLTSAKNPLETAEVVELVNKQIPTTRTIIFKRLTDLRGDQAIKGKHIGSGKGTWIWWIELPTEEKLPPAKHEKIVDKILDTIEQSGTPLETSEVVELVQQEIPTTRTKIFKRLTDLRGDQAINGKHVGSGKGVWIWWRKHAR